MLWELWVTIDTTENTWYVKWSGPIIYYVAPYNGMLSYLWRWDDKGFTHKHGPLTMPCLQVSGEWEISYSNTYTWSYTERMWVYSFDPFTSIPVTLRVVMWIDS